MLLKHIVKNKWIINVSDHKTSLQKPNSNTFEKYYRNQFRNKNKTN